MITTALAYSRFHEEGTCNLESLCELGRFETLPSYSAASVQSMKVTPETSTHNSHIPNLVMGDDEDLNIWVGSKSPELRPVDLLAGELRSATGTCALPSAGIFDEDLELFFHGGSNECGTSMEVSDQFDVWEASAASCTEQEIVTSDFGMAPGDPVSLIEGLETDFCDQSGLPGSQPTPGPSVPSARAIESHRGVTVRRRQGYRGRTQLRAPVRSCGILSKQRVTSWKSCLLAEIRIHAADENGWKSNRRGNRWEKGKISLMPDEMCGHNRPCSVTVKFAGVNVEGIDMAWQENEKQYIGKDKVALVTKRLRLSTDQIKQMMRVPGRSVDLAPK